MQTFHAFRHSRSSFRAKGALKVLASCCTCTFPWPAARRLPFHPTLAPPSTLKFPALVAKLVPERPWALDLEEEERGIKRSKDAASP